MPEKRKPLPIVEVYAEKPDIARITRAMLRLEAWEPPTPPAEEAAEEAATPPPRPRRSAPPTRAQLRRMKKLAPPRQAED